MKRKFTKEHRKNLSKSHIGLNAKEKHPNWNNGIQRRSNGYIAIRIGKHKYQLIHRYIMERELGRKLKASEVVHHIDGDRTNNNIGNLELRERSEHQREHAINQWKEKHALFFK